MESVSNQKRPLRRAEASNYLLEHYGIKRTVATLAKLASVGGGPQFQHDGRTPLYPIACLDEWAARALTPLKSSTSSKVHANA